MSVLACVLLAVGLIFVIIPLAFKATSGILILMLSVLPLLFTIAGLVSCVLSSKKTNIKILWVIIIVLAPLFGPLLWFVWGNSNT